MVEGSYSIPLSSFILHALCKIAGSTTTKHKAIITPFKKNKARSDYFGTWASAGSTDWTDSKKC